jgi:hypothetical protein
MNKKLLYGVGIYERGKYLSEIDGKMSKEYSLWKGMLYRCYDHKHQSIRPTYADCSVSENFKNFQYFAEWCNNQAGFGVVGYQLDKDIIHKGNKQYSAEFCTFVPRQINTLIIDQKSRRGKYPVGVYWDESHSNFLVRLRVKGKQTFLGYYSTVGEASDAYKNAKESHVKLMAEEYKDYIDTRVYDALIKWECEGGYIVKTCNK